jgi:hypothetical protein
MNDERRQTARVISDTLVKEINALADEEKAAFERRSPSSQQSPAGYDSENAAESLAEIGGASNDLWDLGKKPQSAS